MPGEIRSSAPQVHYKFDDQEVLEDIAYFPAYTVYSQHLCTQQMTSYILVLWVYTIPHTEWSLIVNERMPVW